MPRLPDARFKFINLPAINGNRGFASKILKKQRFAIFAAYFAATIEGRRKGAERCRPVARAYSSTGTPVGTARG
jgi:hypothetical protein